MVPDVPIGWKPDVPKFEQSNFFDEFQGKSDQELEENGLVRKGMCGWCTKEIIYPKTEHETKWVGELNQIGRVHAECWNKAQTFSKTEYWTLPKQTTRGATSNTHPPSRVLTSNSFSALENDELTEYGMYK